MLVVFRLSRACPVPLRARNFPGRLKNFPKLAYNRYGKQSLPCCCFDCKSDCTFKGKAMAEDRKLDFIPLGKIKPPKDALRQVDKKKTDYITLVDSVRNKGVLNAILVQRVKDDPEHPYQIVEGYHRYSAAMDAGLEKIPAQIMNMDEVAVIEAQIIGNAQKIETRPAEYAAAIERLFKINPTLTEKEVAQRLNKSTTWLEKTLGLNKLPDKAKALVNEGHIKVSNAYSLANLASVAEDEVENYLERAQTQPPSEFNFSIDQRVRQIKSERKAGRDPSKKNEYVPAPYPRSKPELVSEMMNPKIGATIVKMVEAKTPEDGFAAGVKWALKMDPIAIEEGRKRWEEEKMKSEQEKQARAEERQKKRAEEAKEALAATS